MLATATVCVLQSGTLAMLSDTNEINIKHDRIPSSHFSLDRCSLNIVQLKLKIDRYQLITIHYRSPC